MNTAEVFRTTFPDITELMQELNRSADEIGLEIDQFWEAELTRWTFPDGSWISISGTEIETGLNGAGR